MNCIQLSFDFSEGVAPAKVVPIVAASASMLDDVRALDSAARRQGFARVLVDPCKGCDLAEVCGHDDCAHHLFSLHSKSAPRGDWDAYFERQNLRVRRYGLQSL